MRGGNLVFLLGAGRSGTTLLYKVLAAHRQVAYLSNYQNRRPARTITAAFHRVLNFFPSIKRETWFQKGGGAYFNERRAWIRAIVPTPSEAESVYQYCGLPLNPAPDYRPDAITCNCLAGSFERIRRLSGARVLLTKRTANNRRIPQLVDMFPGARFIHLVRDGRSVAYSLPRVAWWDDHALYWADNRTPRELVAAGADPLELAARNWVEGMHSIEQGISVVEKNALLEVRYESLLANPNEEIGRILAFMGIAAGHDQDFQGLLDSLALKPKRELWPDAWSEQELRLVSDWQRATLERWNYV